MSIRALFGPHPSFQKPRPPLLFIPNHVTLAMIKVFQSPAHDAVSEPSFSCVLVPQYLSIFHPLAPRYSENRMLKYAFSQDCFFKLFAGDSPVLLMMFRL